LIQVQRYRSFQDDENKVVVYDLLKTPEKFVSHFERYATSVVSIVGFGRRVADIQDPLITEVITQMQNAAQIAVVAKDFLRLMETFPCSYLTSTSNTSLLHPTPHFYIQHLTSTSNTSLLHPTRLTKTGLAKFPTWLAPWKRGTRGSTKPRHGRNDFFFALAEETNQCADKNYSKYLFREAPNYKLHPLEISNLAANLLGAGADTSSSTLVTAVLAMRAFPSTLLPA
jgi:hypothetical protein